MVLLILLFVAATIAGYKVVSDVPSLLHTPLMSGMNALSGVTVVGALVITACAVNIHSRLLGSIAVFLATVNIVAGFLVTHRMLRFFKENKSGKKP